MDELNEIERELCGCPAKGCSGLDIKVRFAERCLDNFYVDEVTELAFRSVFDANKALASA